MLSALLCPAFPVVQIYLGVCWLQKIPCVFTVYLVSVIEALLYVIALCPNH